VSIRGKKKWGFYGHSRISHNYEKRSINGDGVVIDHATGLMWYQSGSDDSMSWGKAKKWVRSLNSRGYAGHHDWRLPTLEEAASLLQFDKNDSDLYIDPIFSNMQRWIWTGDKKGSKAAWFVDFYDGSVIWPSFYYGFYVYDVCVRPVRSVE
jgi:serine/threonine-protein kinase